MKARLLLVFSYIFLLSACASITVDYKIETTPSTKLQGRGSLSAGAAKINITPPPGMPLSGFSSMSDYGRGKRTNIMARVLYLNSAEGKSLALIQCDILSGSTIVRSKVAELVRTKTDLGYKDILMAGTHTHSGPGNYFGNMLYNNYASNNSGFEENYFQFLTQRIAEAVVEAYQNSRPAKIATGTAKIEENVTQNRSFPAYLKNENVNASSLTKYDAVNPYMHMVRIDCLDDSGIYTPIGAFSNFSIHPNTKPELLDALYNGDIFAYIARRVELGIKNRYHPPWEPVHAATNYVHGDNNPNYDKNNGEHFPELERIGTIIGEKALELFVSLQEELTQNVEIDLQAKEVNMLHDKTESGYTICDPVIGNALLAGAGGENKYSFLYHIPLFAPGWPKDTETCQGAKRVFFSPFHYSIVDKYEFPHILFLQLIRIDNFVYTPLPFEITYEMGRRMAEQNKSTAESSGLEGVELFIPISCSNGYFGYLTTPEEYSLQYYEGGSNFYGPETGYYVTSHLDQLVTGLAKADSNFKFIKEKHYNMEVARYYPEQLEPEGERETAREPEFHEKTEKRESYWSYRWYDVPPSDIALHKKLIQIEYLHNDIDTDWRVLEKHNSKVDDTGFDIAVIYLDEINKDNMGLYEARWYAEENERGRLRFAVLPRGKQHKFHSSSFCE